MRGAPGPGLLVGTGCAIMAFVIVAFAAGAVILLGRRGEAADAAERARAMAGTGAGESTPASELDAARLDLLALSGEISDPSAKAVDLARAEQRLDSIEVRIEGLRSVPGWIKVRALGESVSIQLDLVRRKGVAGEVPALPPASIAPAPD